VYKFATLFTVLPYQICISFIKFLCHVCCVFAQNAESSMTLGWVAHMGP